MKKLAAFLALIILVMSVCTVGIGETETPENRGKVVVLATGGTIAGVGDPGKIAGYKPGTLTAEVLLWGVPEIDEVADFVGEQRHLHNYTIVRQTLTKFVGDSRSEFVAIIIQILAVEVRDRLGEIANAVVEYIHGYNWQTVIAVVFGIVEDVF